MSAIIDQPAGVPCEHPGCDVTDDVRWECSQTAYHWDGTGEDPNRPLALCRECAEEYSEMMRSMWADYRSSTGLYGVDWD